MYIIIMMENRSLESLRKETMLLLENNFANGVIDLEEYEKRVDIALNTSIKEDLLRISGDLIPLPESGDTEKVELCEHKKDEDLMIGVLSEIKRKGRWEPAKNNKVVTFMGGAKLDFTEVDMPYGVTEINFFCLMGSLDIIVPEGVRVELSGLPVMGSVDNRTRIPEISNAPVLKIRGVALMSSVDVKPPRRSRGWRRNRQ